LGWSPKFYKGLKKRVNTDVSVYLNHARSASNQPAGSIEGSLHLQILADYPKIAATYRDGWPITDLIRLRLKYTSGRI
ncbi:hypothetical protein C8Q76DRAFT_601182, partial [Earliella scabrosa]